VRTLGMRGLLSRKLIFQLIPGGGVEAPTVLMLLIWRFLGDEERPSD
jgi:hypothetical protein